MTGDLPPTLNKSALLKLGWTSSLIAVVIGKPDKIDLHKHGLRSWVEHLYARDRVIAAAKDPRFLALQQRRKLKAEGVVQRRAELPKKFSTWRDALPEACAGMFSLNRYAKHRSCSELHKLEIYRLKNELIELLYRSGYCTLSWIHRLRFEIQYCRRCGGAGDYDCIPCGGSGIFREARTVEFWCFRFAVEGRAYCWHQPIELVKFAPAESVPAQEWREFSDKEKPVPLRREQFALVKELLDWLLRAAAEPQLQVVKGGRAEGSFLPFDESSLFEERCA